MRTKVCCSRSVPIRKAGGVFVRSGQTAEIAVAVAHPGNEKTMRNPAQAALAIEEQLVAIPTGSQSLYGKLTVPLESSGLILFAQGIGSGLYNPRDH